MKVLGHFTFDVRFRLTFIRGFSIAQHTAKVVLFLVDIVKFEVCEVLFG